MKQKLIASTIALIFLGLLGHRVWRSAGLDGVAHNGMPLAHRGTEEEYRKLYFTPGGAYTQSDIRANGNTTPRQEYRGFQARHDFNPLPGDRICPITRTKATSRCTWIVGGRTYEFCCPPCIDEFVRRAKREPDRIQPPEQYVQRPAPERSPQ